MKIRFSAFVSAVLVALMVAAGGSISAYAADGLHVTEHSQQQIKEYIAKAGVSVNDEVTYTREPVKDTVRGELSPQSKAGALAMLNNIRYIAGLDPVALDDKYGSLAQAGAFVDMSIDELTHYPGIDATKPENMSDQDWNDGITGAGKSNLAWGYWTLNLAVLGWMDDGDKYNIDRIGHRRWCINPGMGKTGFGAAGAYYAMYSFDGSGTGTQTNIAWPSANMPVEYFDEHEPWSLSTGTSVTKENITVSLTRKSDGKNWTFSGLEKYDPSSEKYFNVDNQGYGKPGCIIFRPDGVNGYHDGDEFAVRITEAGKDNIEYTVRFFELNHSLVKTDAKEATCTAEGNREYWTCSSCGRFFSDADGKNEILKSDWSIPAKGHAWSTEYTTDKAATYTTEGSKSIHCLVCGQIKEGSQQVIPKLQHNNAENGDASVLDGSSYTVTSASSGTVAFTKAKNVKSVKVPATVTINGKKYKVTKVSANAFRGKNIRTVTIGANVGRLSAKAFNGSKAKTIIIKSRKLTKSAVKGSLKGSAVKTVKVKVGKAKDNKTYVKKYKKIFTKKNCGKKVTVK